MIKLKADLRTQLSELGEMLAYLPQDRQKRISEIVAEINQIVKSNGEDGLVALSFVGISCAIEAENS